MADTRSLRRALESLGLSARGLNQGRHYAFGIDKRGRAYVVAFTQQAKAILLANAEMIRDELANIEA